MSIYQEYKPSGIEWIGEIPSHWKLKRIKTNFYLKGRIGWQELRTDEFTDEGIHCVTGTDFKNGIVNWNTCYRVSNERYEVDANIQLFENDLLITKDGTIGKVALVKKMPGKATLNSGIFLLRPLKKIFLNDFIYWILNSSILSEFNNYTKTGATISHLYQNVFERMKFCVPSIPEQQEIVDHLEKEIAAVDLLIFNKSAQLEKLKELRQIEINNAVTRGLNNDIELKDSGIDWIGDIPIHWKCKRIKNYCSKINSGVTPKGGADVYLDEGIPLFRSQNIHFDGLRLEDIAFINEDTHDLMVNSKVEFNDVLLNITGASLGRCFYYSLKDTPANVNQHVAIIRPKHRLLSYKYLYYLLSSSIGQAQIFINQNGTSREGLTFEEIKNIIISLPPFDEQLEIVDHLEKYIGKLDSLIENIEKQIEKLEELRKVKIYEAVTGKIKVS